ncbi:hypothetical protein [Sphingobium subterraneum]|uniref:Ribosomal protein L16 Arg81 hydroxylase n=1 Tax=Sphingobium subterraneum TaxID=627688 RepID=A0A841J6R5_9SPHN|nr:hypothetical protein [Sphingobium subterraneum]MBB6124225.1 ribosomal protein L16 Arg81 hydroxylase [Sphingobium subterraneum]
MSESDRSYLQARAKRFRRIAREVNDKATSDELNEIAEGLDAEAEAVRVTERIPPPSE